ncbi:MAG: hypothetical protein ACI9XZ_003804, partial [Alphaproteobacteria bacterium]
MTNQRERRSNRLLKIVADSVGQIRFGVVISNGGGDARIGCSDGGFVFVCG